MTRQSRIFIALPVFALLAWWAGLFDTGRSLDFDQARLERIGAHYQAAIDAKKVAGAQAVIIQNGRTVYDEKWGFRDLANQKPIGDDTIFHIYSMTKPITSVAVMTLAEEGKLLLHAPIAEYIPELADLKVYDPVNGKGTPPYIL